MGMVCGTRCVVGPWSVWDTDVWDTDVWDSDVWDTGV